MSEILNSLKGLAADQPEKVAALVDQAKAKWASMTPAEQSGVLDQLNALKDKLTTLTDEQRKALTDKIASLR